MPQTLKIAECPTCGSRKIKLVRNEFRRSIGKRRVVLPELPRWECPDCGEILFDSAALKRLQETWLPRPRQKKVSA